MRATMKLICALLLSFTALWAQADANKGQIAGTVFDAKQAVVPGASVKLRNLDTGFTREVTTNELGQYRVVALDPGPYELVAQSAGFAASTVTGLQLSVGSTLRANVTLQVASTTTTIEVGETLVNVGLPAPSQVVSREAIRDLPINGRRFQDFALTAPTVQVDNQRGQLSFVGQRGINSNIMLDGADFNQPFFGGIRGGERSNQVFTVPQSAIQEFQVVTTGYAAEYGRSTGGIMNVITRSGGNDYHGEAFYQLRHKELGLKTPFNRQSLETQHQFGGAVGGPIKSDKLFWFAAVERQVSRNPRLVFFPRLAGLASNANNSEALAYFKSLEQPFTQTNDGTALVARTDYQLSGGHRLTARYTMSRANGENSTTTGSRIEPTIDRALSNNGTEQDRTHTGGLQFTSLLGPSAVNDLRFSTTYELRPRLANNVTPTVSTTMGTFGVVDYLPNTQDDMRIQIADGLSVTRGTHTFKFGMDFNRITTFQRFGFSQVGSFYSSGSDVAKQLDLLSVGGSIANRFDDTTFTYRRAIGNYLVDLGIKQIAGYAQDSWRVTPQLSLDYGLRWEGQWNPMPEANNADLVNRVKGMRFPVGGVDPTTIPDSPSQLMPRFGFAWTPFKDSQRTVVRGHTGIFYAATPMLLLTGPLNNFRIPPGDLRISLPRAGSTIYKDLLAVGVDLNKYSLDKLPILDIETVQRAATGSGTLDPYRGTSPVMMANDYKNPRAFQAGLGMDSELFRGFVAGVQLHYVNTVHLERNRDFNMPVPTVRPTDKALRPFFGLRSGNTRPQPLLDQITVRESSARSMYRGMTLSSQYRKGRFQFGAFYTLSEAFSDDDNERSSGGTTYLNTFRLVDEYGYSELDRRHQLAGYGIFSAPWGIELSTKFSAVSGRAIDPSTGADTNEDRGGNDRAFEAPGVPMKRNSFRNRGTRNIDFRFLKSFRMWNEKSKLQFSCEMFNIFNFDNVVYSGTNLNYGLGVDPATGSTLAPLATFKRLRLADGTYDPINIQIGNPFQAQMGLRLVF